MTIRPLASLDVKDLPKGRALQVCIVSLIGAARNGGIGTATDAMARHIALDGHDVTLLYSLVEHGIPVNVAQPGNDSPGLRNWADWQTDLAADGVRLERLDHRGAHNDWLEKSWQVKEFLGRGAFDVVYFDEWQGTGYYALLAKQAGLQPFARQLHVVFTHASKQWVSVTNDEPLQRPSDITVMGMERRSVEMADVVISPSRYLLEEYARYGWALPANSFHHPLPLLKSRITPDERRRPVDEIVFFGRLETRKGLWLFCDALDRLGDRLSGKTVTFMGPVTAAFGSSSAAEVVRRSAGWKFRIRLVTDFGSREAQAYIAAGPRLAVMPSLDDNSPCVIYECMQAGIPFVTTTSGGGKELIDQRFWPDALVDPTVDALTDRIAALLRDGARAVAPSFDPTAALDVWTGWLRLVAQDPGSFRTPQKGNRFVLSMSPPLLVVLDRGDGKVGRLVDNIVDLTQRFGGRARIVILSDRRGATLAIVRTLLARVIEAGVTCLGPTELDTARPMIEAAEVAFFLDAEDELLAPFFLLALGILAQPDTVMVSCLGATRDDAGSGMRIETLPAGNIPGLAELGHVVAGPVWAIAPARLGPGLPGLILRDMRHDLMHKAWTMGEALARRLPAFGQVLLPIVGALIPAASPANPLRTAESLRHGASQSGLGNSLFAGGAAWFGIMTFGFRAKLPAGALSLANPALPSFAAQGDLAALAARTGRIDLALQILAAQGDAARRAEQVTDIAVQVERQRQPIDLLPALAMGMTARPEFDELDRILPISVHHDPRLSLVDGNLRATVSTRSGGPARIHLLDVATAGHVGLLVRIRQNAPDAVFLRLRVIDLECGEEIGLGAIRLDPRQVSEATVALPGGHVSLGVILEFSGADRLDLSLDRLALA